MKATDSKNKLVKELKQISARHKKLQEDRKNLLPVLILLSSRIDVLTDKDMKILKSAFAKLDFMKK